MGKRIVLVDMYELSLGLILLSSERLSSAKLTQYGNVNSV